MAGHGQTETTEMPPAVEALYIRATSTRTEPKPYTVYHVEVHLAGPAKRSYTVFKRYSQFTELHADLESDTKEPPPVNLPLKHTWSLFHATIKDEALIQERKAGLEFYLRTLLTCKEPRWRESHRFLRFLEVPATKQFISTFTLSSWLDEHASLSTVAREIRGDLAKRDSLGGDPVEARKASVDAKTKLASLVSSLSRLAVGLDELAKSGNIAEGELRRRADLVSKLQDEVETSSRLANSLPARTIQSRREQPPAKEDPGTLAARSDLLGSVKPSGRVLGSAARSKQPQETDVTRPLDNFGLVQLQKETLSEQDDRLSSISSVLRRQRALGEEIHSELVGQNELLDSLSQEVDSTERRLGKASQKMKKLG
jgi:regulator of vacuolar morphogenesis